MDNTYLKAGHEVAVGDTVVESDGFLWTVTETERFLKTILLTLIPKFPGMTARDATKLRVKRSASVRVLRPGSPEEFPPPVVA